MNDADEEILNQAAHWCLRLQEDDCTPDERHAFQQWIQQSPRHAFEYAKMLEIWDISERLPNHSKTRKKLLSDSPLHEHKDQSSR